LVLAHFINIGNDMILEFDGVQFRYDEHPLLSGIYVKCEQGKVTGLLGRNGSGKSTLLKIVFGAIRTDVLSVRIDQISISPPAFKSLKIAYLPQENFIPNNLSLRAIMKLFEINEEELFDDFPELQISVLLKANELSGGWHRLFEVLLILNSKASFCLLDEPFTGLAPAIVERLQEVIRYKKQTKGILITDHLYRQVISLSDSLYLLTNGKTYFVKDESDLVQRGYLLE
jgi:ABC-type multidrug transport system ATPase subunit